MAYLREDGICLADSPTSSGATTPTESEATWRTTWATPAAAVSDQPAQHISDSDDSEDDEDSAAPAPVPPNRRFPDLHKRIADSIASLGGAVAPKLNWSSPKDAAWISPYGHTLECRNPNDVYLLLKSSNFVSFDLERAFDGCVGPGPGPSPGHGPAQADLDRRVLVLRRFLDGMAPHLEFRCFVKDRELIGISQRHDVHWDFLADLRDVIVSRIEALFERELRTSFPDPSFVFDVYIPELGRAGASDAAGRGEGRGRGSDGDGDEDEDATLMRGLGRARLVDINPWAPRTDPLLFDWTELVAWRVGGTGYLGVVTAPASSAVPDASDTEGDTEDDADYPEDDDDDEGSEGDGPDLRLVGKDDRNAFNYTSMPYAAHRKPLEVVEAGSSDVAGLRAFAEQWRDFVARTGG